MKILSFAAAATAALLAAPAPAAIVTADLPSFGTDARATGINASGHLAGNYTFNGKIYAWIWQPGGGIVYPSTELSEATVYLADDDRAGGTFKSPSTGTTFPFTWKEGDPNAGYTAILPAGGVNGAATGLNASGRLVANYTDTTTTPSSKKASTWTVSGGYKELTPAGALSSTTWAVSAGGGIAGWYATGAGKPVLPCLWTAPAATHVPLVLPLGISSGAAFGVSESKGAVGNYTDSGGKAHACGWSGAGYAAFRDLTPPPSTGAVSSQALAIDASGLAAGTYFTENGYYYCAWTNAADEASFAVVSPEQAESSFLLVAGGRFVGNTYLAYPAPETRAITWQAGVLTSLLPAGAKSSYAYALGADGTVAGAYVTASGQKRAFVWNSGVARDVTPAGAVAAMASVANASGIVGGHYLTADGKAHIFTATTADGTVLALTAGPAAPVFAETATISDLPVGAHLPLVTGINASGHLAGSYIAATGDTLGWMWQPGTAVVSLTPDIGDYVSLAGDDRLGGSVEVPAAEGSRAAFTWKEGDANAGYTLIANPAGGKNANVVGMNVAGGVVGTYTDSTISSNPNKAFMWTKAGGYKALTPAGAFSSTAWAMSPGGAIAGHYATASGQPARPCVWSGAASTHTPLALPAGATGGVAFAVNETKGAVGSFNGSGGKAHACAWTGAGYATLVDLSPPSSADAVSSEALAIGASGLVAGRYITASGEYLFGVWADAADAGSFSPVSPELAAEGIFVSAGGRFAGNTYIAYPAPETRAITWQAGVLTSLLPVGAKSSFVQALGDDGTVVGFYMTAGGQKRAFAWKGGVARDITPAGATEAVAWVANAAGTIGGHYLTADGRAHVFTVSAASGTVLTLTAEKPSPGTPTPVPAAKPTVAIAGKKKITTTKATLKVKGTTTGAVTKVTLLNGKKVAKATGTASWSAKVKLKPGVNTLVVTAVGPGGVSAPAKMTILRK